MESHDCSLARRRHGPSCTTLRTGVAAGWRRDIPGGGTVHEASRCNRHGGSGTIRTRQDLRRCACMS
eukprot:10352-Eustigmatos_ZCMA.PRE.1